MPIATNSSQCRELISAALRAYAWPPRFGRRSRRYATERRPASVRAAELAGELAQVALGGRGRRGRLTRDVAGGGGLGLAARERPLRLGQPPVRGLGRPLQLDGGLP